RALRIAFAHVAFFGQRAKCDAAHTSLRLFPIKIRQPGNQEGTHGTKTSYRRDCSCNGVDHPNGHGVGQLVTDFRSSTFAFVLRHSDQLWPPALDARQGSGPCCVTRSSLLQRTNLWRRGTSSQTGDERLSKRSALHKAYTIRQSEEDLSSTFPIRSANG